MEMPEVAVWKRLLKGARFLNTFRDVVTVLTPEEVKDVRAMLEVDESAEAKKALELLSMAERT